MDFSFLQKVIGKEFEVFGRIFNENDTNYRLSDLGWGKQGEKGLHIFVFHNISNYKANTELPTFHMHNHPLFPHRSSNRWI